MNSSPTRTNSILRWIAVISLCVFIFGCSGSPESPKKDDSGGEDAVDDQGQGADVASAADMPFAPVPGAGFENMPSGTPVPVPVDLFEGGSSSGDPATSYLPAQPAAPLVPMSPIDYEALGPRNNFDLSLLPSVADMVMILHPARLCSAPELGPLVTEIVGEYLMMDDLFQIEPSQIEQLILTSSMASDPLSPGAGSMMLFRFVAPVDVERIAQELLPETEGFTRVQAEINGHAYWTFSPTMDDPMMMPVPGAMQMPCTAVLDERTVVHFAMAPNEQVLSRQVATGPLAERVARTNLNRDAIMLVSLERDANLGAQISEDFQVQFMSKGEEFFQTYGDLIAIPSLMRAGELSFSLQEGTLASLMIEATNPTNTLQVNAVAQKHFGTLQEQVNAMLTLMSTLSGGSDPQINMLNQLAGEAFGGLAIANPSETRTQLDLQHPASLNTTAPVFLAKALQTLRARKELELTVGKMRSVWAALVMTQPLPKPVTVGADGSPLLSWRVAVLPQLGEQELYNQFHHNEPWDSPHNLTLLPQIPEAYKDPAVELGRTRICVFTGVGTPLSIENLDLNAYAVQSKVALVQVGADRAVPWTAPVDVAYNPATLAQSLGTGDENGEFTVLQFNGWPAGLSTDLEPAYLSQFVLLTQEELSPPPEPALTPGAGSGMDSMDWLAPPANETGVETSSPTVAPSTGMPAPPPSAPQAGGYVPPATAP